MSTVILLRHGRSTANAQGILAGRSPGIELDETGRAQADAVGERLAPLRLARVVSSPLLRCVQTAEAVLARQGGGEAITDDRLIECDYGQWQGRPLSELAREPLWETVQTHPSQMVFPGGESMRAMQDRAVAAVREIDAAVTTSAGSGATWLAVSHGDLISAILGDALGMDLDAHQRLTVLPASISAIAYTTAGPRVLIMNSTGADLTWLGGQTAPAVGGQTQPSA